MCGEGVVHGEGVAYMVEICVVGGVSMAGRGMHGREENAHGMEGGHLWQGNMHAGETTTEAGGTHPTRMPYC